MSSVRRVLDLYVLRPIQEVSGFPGRISWHSSEVTLNTSVFVLRGSRKENKLSV